MLDLDLPVPKDQLGDHDRHKLKKGFNITTIFPSAMLCNKIQYLSKTKSSRTKRILIDNIPLKHFLHFITFYFHKYIFAHPNIHFFSFLSTVLPNGFKFCTKYHTL